MLISIYTWCVKSEHNGLVNSVVLWCRRCTCVVSRLWLPILRHMHGAVICVRALIIAPCKMLHTPEENDDKVLQSIVVQ